MRRFGTVQWVLSRPLYRFRHFNLKNVPRAQYAQALRLQIEQWSPYASTGRFIAWQADHALVWIWDNEALEADLVAHKLQRKTIHVIPESLLHSPLASGLRLVDCLDGVEGQLWQEQSLTHSRWWPEPPSSIDWLNFQRDAGMTPDQGLSGEVPALQTIEWLKQPWAKSSALGRGGRTALAYEAWIVAGTSLLLAAFTTWNGIELIKTRQATDELKVTLDAATESARPLFEARRQALDAQVRIESLRAIDPYPPQVALMAEVAKQMPNDSFYLKDWDYQNGKLKITIASSSQLSSSFLVKKIQDIAWFKNVQATPGTDPTVLTLTMETLQQGEFRPQVKTAENTGAPGTTPPDPAAKTAPNS